MKETTLSSEKIYEGRVITLKVDKIRAENGNEGVREYVTHGGGAAVLAVKDGKVLLERQYRYPYGEVIWEIPAGKRDKGEDYETTAKREFEEETGLIASSLKKIAYIYPSPGYTNEVIGIFYAEGLSNGKTHFDDTEDVECNWVDLKKTYEMIESGEIKDSKTLIALLWYKAEND